MSAPICLWSLVRQRQWIFLGFNPFRDQLQVVNPNIRLKWFWLSGIRPGAAGVSQSHAFLGFNPFMFDLLSRKCHAETQKARLMQDDKLYFRSVSSWSGEVKILQQNCIWKGFPSFFAIFCPNNPWTGHAITSSTQYDHCSRFVNQTRACDQLSRQAHSFPKAHEMFRNHELGQPFSQCQKQVLWLNCDFSLDTSCIRAISSNKLHSPASWLLNWFITLSYYKVI